MNPQTAASRIAQVTYIPTRAPWYVADLPGCNRDVREPQNPRSDWGYTEDIAKALPLSPYWQRRFAADSRRCNRIAQFFEVRTWPSPSQP